MPEATPSIELSKALQQAVADIFAVERIVLDPHQAGVVRLYGRFLVDTAEAYQVTQRRFDSLGYTPLFREEKEIQVIEAIPGKLPTEEPNLRLAIILFAVTVVSTLFVGITSNWDETRLPWENISAGIIFALSLLGILVAHEMGHYVVARHFNVPVTLPYFIPFPINFLGTMGAFIRMKAPPKNRRDLLAVGVAGPLAGLIVALPLLAWGFILSPIEPLPTDVPYFLEGNSLLYAFFKILIFGRFLPSGGEDVMLHPMAFAAWAGLFVTGLNLIPAGTLDGGHVAYALLGKKAKYLTWAMIIALAALGSIMSIVGFGDTGTGWFIWAGLIFFLGRRSAIPLDDITQLEPWQFVLAAAVLMLFIVTFMPIPFRIVNPA